MHVCGTKEKEIDADFVLVMDKNRASQSEIERDVMAAIEFENIHKSFGKDDARIEVLKGVSGSVAEGEMVAVMGKSGSGKSTLLNILGGLMAMDEGSVLCGGEPIDYKHKSKLCSYRKNDVGFIVQYFALIEDINVFDNVALSLRFKKESKADIRRKVHAMLRELGIDAKAKAYPNQLSGGQKQRVAIARALVKEPQIILADEPTGALDEATGIEVINILKAQKEKGKTVIVVTHDPKVAEMCDRVIRIKDGVLEK